MHGLILDDYYRRYECQDCDRSFNSPQALYQHCENTSQHSWCSSCQATFDDDDQLRNHELWAEAHRTCGVCGKVFENAHNLEMHDIVHRPASIECVACPRKFRSASGMLIHLETGCKEGDWDEEATQQALMFFTRRNPKDYGFVCSNAPAMIACGCKGTHFHQVSALFQHIESGQCILGQNVVLDAIKIMRGRQRDGDFEKMADRWGDHTYR